MKKLFGLLCVLFILCALTVSVYAGDVSFSVSEEDETTGTQISFLEYLCKDSSYSSSDTQKVTFRIHDELHEVDKDEFFKIAKDIIITDANNYMLKDMGPDLYSSSSASIEQPYRTILYIELLDADEQLVHYGAVSRHGEVDRYSLFMSRLMMNDYEMSLDDLEKLYSLFPDDVTNVPDIIPETQTPPLELPAISKKNYAPYIWGGAALIFVLAFVTGFVFYNKKCK